MTRLRAWNASAKGVFKTRMAKPICRPSPQKITRGWMARRLLENRYATAITTTRPSRPVKRSMRSLRSTYDFENEFAALRRSRSDAESIFDKLRSFVDIVFASVIQAAKNAAGIHLLTNLHFEDH